MKTSEDILEERLRLAWEAYLTFLSVHGIPLPEDMAQARLLFRGGFVYCMAYYLPDTTS